MINTRGISTALACSIVALSLVGCNKNVVQDTASQQVESSEVRADLAPNNATQSTDTVDIATAKQWFIEKRYDQAFKALRVLASEGDADAQYGLGYLYYYGKGTAADRTKGIEWITASAKQGFPNAQKALDILKIELPGKTPQSETSAASLVSKPIQNDVLQTTPLAKEAVKTLETSPKKPNEVIEKQALAPKLKNTGVVFGPTTANDTLWSIAKNTRPSRDISIKDMMAVLVANNPDAFIDGKATRMRRHVELAVPTLAQINAYLETRAIAKTSTQKAIG